MNDKEKLITDFLETPTTYHIEVIDNSDLPDKLKNREVIDFVVKPPTLLTITKTSKVLERIPKDIFDMQKVEIKDAIKYVDEMVELFCIYSHGKKSDYPEWYEPFIKTNVTSNEIFALFKDIAVKSQTSFFLHSLKMLDVTNPMRMNQTKKPDLTPTDL